MTSSEKTTEEGSFFVDDGGQWHGEAVPGEGDWRKTLIRLRGHDENFGRPWCFARGAPKVLSGTLGSKCHPEAVGRRIP